MKNQIRVAFAGIGNCCSFLVQSIEKYKNAADNLGGYRLGDITPVAAFDVDKNKVGKDLSEAVAEANTINTENIAKVPRLGVEVMKGPVLDGIGEYLGKAVKPDAKQKPVDVADVLKKSKADILINYLPVGSYEASRYYAQAAIDAGCGFINCIPEFISSDKEWAKKFEDKKLPIIGDDIKGQLGASILSRTLVKLFSDRGGKIDRMYQLNFGGNTDFLNLLEESRLKFKRISKTETVQSQAPKRIEDENIHIGPSDFVPWLKSRKVAYIRIEGRTFGDIPINLDVRLDVEDKSVSAGVVVDAIRCCKVALDRKTGGPLLSASAFYMKSPPQQFPDSVAKEMVEEFVKGIRER